MSSHPALTRLVFYSARTSHFGNPSSAPGHADRSRGSDLLQPKPKTQAFYAVVVHDFIAERADELDAKRGDPISIVAQSNREWFVAKPIGRLGRPGLIPVTFVEVRDPTTNRPIADIEALMDRGDLPKVEDWKRAMMDYKQNSISLGVIEDTPQTNVSNSPYNSQLSPPAIAEEQPRFSQQQEQPPTPASTLEYLPPGVLLSANVVSFHFEMEEFWFRIDAIFQPFPPSNSNVLPSARQLVLFRVYNDFYDFQISMLDTFPREAGRVPPHPRILPYMPGPADNVDGEVTASRRVELADYLHKLCDLSGSGSKYILEHEVVRSFLSLRPGDVENRVEPRVEEMETLYGHVFGGGPGGYEPVIEERVDYVTDVRNAFSQMQLSDPDVRKSEGSEYEDEGYAPSPQRHGPDHNLHPYSSNNTRAHRGESQSSLSLRQHAHNNHQRSGSASSFNHEPYLRSGSRAESPLPGSSRDQPRAYSPLRISNRSAPETDRSRSGEYNRSQEDDTQRASSTRSRSQSVSASANITNPPISGANPQTAFIKIKIFDRVADDLIAIRVHPRVSHAELMEKVQARLGGEVAQLRYRESMSRSFIELQGDHDLRAWLAGTDKYVLYAD